MDRQQSRVVELRYFAGLSAEETAETMGISQRTVEREWSLAKPGCGRNLPMGNVHDSAALVPG